MKTPLLGLALVLCSFQMLSAQAHQFRGSNRDGHYPDQNLLNQWPDTGPEVVLELTDLGSGYAMPSVTKEGIFVAGEKDSIGTLYAFTHQGELIWSYTYGKEFMYKYTGSRSTPTINGKFLYCFGSMGDAFCLKTKTGEDVWHVNLVDKYGAALLRWGNTESPLVVGNKVIFSPGGTEHNVIALNKQTGELIWTCKGMGDKSTYCSPILIEQNGKEVIVTQMEKHIIGINAANGDLLWSVENNSPRGTSPNAPIVHNGRMFNSIGYKYGSDMFQLKDDFSTPDTIWTNRELDSKMDGPLLIDGYIYGCGDRNKKWFCLNWQTGKKMWESKEIAIGASIFADGKIYVHGYDGSIAMMKPNPNKCEILSTYGGTTGEKLLFAHPSIFEGKLYIRERSKLLVYNISKN